MHELGIERLCVFGMPPVEFVHLAADLGCRWIGIGTKTMRSYNPHGYSDWSLQDDPALRRAMRSAMDERQVGISLLEGFAVGPGRDVRMHERDLDMLCELGGSRINAASIDRDLNRTCDGFAMLAELAAARNIEVTIEIGPGPIANLRAALLAVRHVARSNFRLLIDTMHFFRLGSTLVELAAIDPGLIGYVQLCDAPRISLFQSYMDEALHERCVPGEGELPLRDVLALVPADVIVSLEVPQRSLAEAGVSPRDRVGACLAATRALMAECSGA